jgi:exopolysaccharide biosynthesis polyprenyl glycosylphosphotransferase
MKMETFTLGKPGESNLQRKARVNDAQGHVGLAEYGGKTLVPEEMFTRALSLERKRSQRSRQRFVLMLIDTGSLLQGDQRELVLSAITKAIATSTRETDLWGWYKKDVVVGVVCTEIGEAGLESILSALHTRVTEALRTDLTLEQMNVIHISFHVFPDDLDLEHGTRPADIKLYPDLKPRDNATKFSLAIKRAIDIVGSAIALLLLSPVFIVIAVGIKLTSKGPILFKQQRLGRYGARFTFLKFRSMSFQSDAKIHREYVRQLIAAKQADPQSDKSGGIYKIKDDPRVTRIGRFIRKTSLDELPQFLNVLKGEMSLVGPRPPIPYEVESYDIWHRRRFLETKPGITGLWQVEGRSRVKFDDMVRLDLKYARIWSPWLDIKILLRTPKAVLRGDGAY